MKSSSTPWELISLHLSGHATDDDRRELDAWLAEAPGRRAELAELEQRWAAAGSERVALDAAALWQETVDRFHAHDQAPVRPSVVSRSSFPGTRAIGVGVGLVAALAIAWPFAASRLQSPPRSEHVYSAPQGRVAQIALPDGSRLTLGPATVVRLRGRVAQVDGQAEFAVASHKDDPFVVETRQSIVRVLGTRFMVRQYASDRSSQVAVVDGKVQVESRAVTSNKSGAAVLAAQMVAMVSDSGVVVSRGIAVEDLTAWTHGRLVFDEVPLREVVETLERTYDVEIQLSDTTMARQRVTMAVSVGSDEISQVLDLMCRSINARASRVGKGFVVSPGRGTTMRSAPSRKELRLITQENGYGR